MNQHRLMMNYLAITKAVPPNAEITDDQPTTKKQKLSNKEVEDIIMGNELLISILIHIHKIVNFIEGFNG